MKHPAQELWMDYIYGELSKPRRAELAAHLKSCPSCAAQLTRWGAVQARLDDWQLPEAKRPWRVAAGLRWAMAAAFMIAALVIGFGAGRASSIKALRQEMQAALEQAQHDNRLLLTAMQQLDAARQEQILGVRNDLEIVAINADNTFREQQQLIQSAYAQATEPDTK